MTESRLKIGSFRWPHCFGCSVSLLYKHNVTDLSEEQGDMTLASESQTEISGLTLALFLTFCSLHSILMGLPLCEIRMKASRLTRTGQLSQLAESWWSVLRLLGWKRQRDDVIWRRKEGVPGRKVRISLGFVLLIHYIGNIFFLVRIKVGQHPAFVCQVEHIERYFWGMCFINGGDQLSSKELCRYCGTLK